MSAPQPDIDRLVREVLAQLGVGDRAAGASGRLSAAQGATGSQGATGPQGATGGLPASAGEDVARATATAASDGEFIFSGRVVTLAEVGDRLATMRRLVVPPRAVVTPAVRDELHRRSIPLVFTSAAAASNCQTVGLCLVTVDNHFDPAPLAAALAAQGLKVESHATNCLIKACDQLAAAVAEADRLGLLLTAHTAAALCLANRHRGVRAVSGADGVAISAAVAAVGANLLVLDSAARSLWQLTQTAAEFCRGATGKCPAVFQERLG